MGLSSAHILIADKVKPELEVIDYQASKPVGAPKSVGNKKFVQRLRAGC
jgi:hypothetical protein